MAKHKYTRKQLRKPDEFISFSMKAWGAIQHNAPRVIITLMVSLVVVAGVWTWSYFSEAKAMKGTGKISRAFDIYNQTVVPMSEKLPEKKEGDIPRFKTRKAKLEAAEKEFSKVLTSSSGDLETMSLLMRAGVKFDQRNYKSAVEDLKKFLSRSKNEQFRIIATESLVYCFEAQKSYDEALKHIKKLPQNGDEQWTAKYHEARILAKKGKKKEALKIFKQIVEKGKPRAVVNRASDQLTLLEIK